MIYLEDLTIGATFATSTITITADDIRRFAGQFDPQPFHLDRDRAKNSPFGDLVASGWHTAALTMRLIVDGELQLAGGIVGRGIDLLEWPQPVRPGDSLHVISEVMTLRPSQRRPDRGVVKFRNTTYNQRNEIVQVMVSNLIALRRNDQQQ